jgi:GxxExxY protein
MVSMTLEHEDLSRKIIGAAIEVHQRLGPGFLESIYESALVIELRKRGLKVDQQVILRVYYDDLQVGEHRLDLIVEDLIILELKAIQKLEDVHFAIVKSYLRAAGKQHGLILNIAKPTLEARRVICA